MCANARFQSNETTSNFGTEFAQNYMNDKTFEKNKHWNHNKHIVMYPSTKFQSISRNPDYRTKFARETWVKKMLEK